MMLSAGIRAALAGAIVAAGFGAAAQDLSCPAVPLRPLLLPHTQAVLARNHQVLIVALGSSSTAGWRATDVAHSYPALLQTDLNRLLPAADVAVINRGIGGQDAPQEYARLAPDVLALRPQMVIWQVGTNAALKAMPVAGFSAALQAGIAALRAAGIDVVLMDNQRAPRVDSAAGLATIDAVIGRIADTTGADLFSRSALMDRWRQRGAGYADFVSPDGLHHNDRGYRCVADALAESIARGVATAPQAEALAAATTKGG